MIKLPRKLLTLALLILLAGVGCATRSNNLEHRVDALEQSQARQYYLIRCDLCDLYAKPGTPENEQCIIMETKRWITIKEKRGW
jgi:hypothetical protein